MSKLTKIIATLGPATETEEIIEQLIAAGMNVARFNTKHSDPAWHAERIARVKTVAARMNAPVAILLDLQGPEIRIVLPEEKSFDVAPGDLVTFTANPTPTEPNSIIIPADVVAALKAGDQVTLADGECEFEVTEASATAVKAKAKVAATIKHRKTMNTPGVELDMPSLTERDYAYLDGVSGEHIDYVGLSFVRNKKDIAILREELAKRNIDAAVIAKIENQAAVDRLDEIIEASDAIMVARGDLGVEVPFQELIYWQQTIIRKSRVAAKPVITATEMLKSMIDKPRPTRAEVSDVAHAIYDGTDAVMLSEETTIGKYPVKAVATQAIIAEFNELHAKVRLEHLPATNTAAAITQAAISLLEDSKLAIDKIVCLTETGATAQFIARFRPQVKVYGLTAVKKTYHRLNLVYGVTPVLYERDENSELTEEAFIEDCKKMGVIASGEHVLLVRGKLRRKSGFTNTVSVIEVA